MYADVILFNEVIKLPVTTPTNYLWFKLHTPKCILQKGMGMIKNKKRTNSVNP